MTIVGFIIFMCVLGAVRNTDPVTDLEKHDREHPIEPR